ncbi:MAG TPA: hypothetical protein VEU32_07170 [Burkholderiales bacterium]|nr:hypothetical protein [Burkholderiales bacterium]
MIRSLCVAVLLVFAARAAPAQSVLRTIPADTKRGTMSHVQSMTVSIDGKNVDLAAGAQIRDARNMIVVPTAVPAGVLVKYQLGEDGKLTRAWILSPQEAAQPDPKK